jgi:hypothetical protein
MGRILEAEESVPRGAPASALSGEVGVATEMLLTKAEQVSDDGGVRRRVTPGATAPASRLSRPLWCLQLPRVQLALRGFDRTGRSAARRALWRQARHSLRPGSAPACTVPGCRGDAPTRGSVSRSARLAFATTSDARSAPRCSWSGAPQDQPRQLDSECNIGVGPAGQPVTSDAEPDVGDEPDGLILCARGKPGD